ncbi:hypothetical protein OIU84_027499 [Salix udensis]|uniref:Uncharacterized protein n=1 Tax=Salix udensis TaxID=889485 RepID=A0AAD6PAQ0_9ROSI|nr:hypothetical protein OIU84_027499 [Salix udensis]
MKPRTKGTSSGQKAQDFQGEGRNWILIAGGALLRNMKSSDRRSPGCNMHSNMYSFTQDDDGCYNCVAGNEGIADMKHRSNDQMLSESDVGLPLVTVPAAEFTKENGIMWASSPDRLELPPKPFHHSNCSDSPCVSESGSDILSKREVIQKLRQQLKRRDDMILEMQDQILELQNSLNAQLTLASNLQSQINAANRDLFDSEREIQRLRKAIADHWDSNFESFEKGGGDVERIEKLKREVGELKEVIEGKGYLLQSYKEQKTELSMKIKELQLRLDSQVPNIL